MVPCVNDACSDMLALGRDLVGVRGFLDGDGKLLVGPGSQLAVSKDLALVC